MIEQKITETTNWPDVALSLYERLTGWGAEMHTTSEIWKCMFQTKSAPKLDTLPGKLMDYGRYGTEG